MRRAAVIGVILGATAIVGVAGTALAGGGGCHAGATQADETGAKEATVRIADACFTASLTMVDPGTEVTFVNEDWTRHNVGGNEWGYFEDMMEGDAFTATFSDPGIYPFACSYHPGMTGAIVVGDGRGAGNGSAISVEPFEPAAKDAVPVTTEPEGVPPIGLVAVGLLSAGLGAAAGIGVTRSVRSRGTA